MRRVGANKSLVDWTDGKELVTLADGLADAARPTVPAPERDQYSVLEQRYTENYNNAVADKGDRFTILRRVLDDASYVRMRRSFGMVLKYITLSAIIAGAGVALFAWSTHPPKVDLRKSAVLIVPAATVQAPQSYLGADCDPTTLKVEALGDTNLISISAASSTSDKTCVLGPPPPTKP